MPSSVHHDLSGLPARFYDAAMDDTLWPEVIGELKAGLAVSMVGFGWLAPQQTDMLYSDCGAEQERRFNELGANNIYLPRMIAAAPGEVFSERAIMAREDFLRSTMFAEWFVRQDVNSGMLVRADRFGVDHAFLAMHRSGRQPAFDEQDEAALRRLAPALVHAFDLRRRLEEAGLRHRGGAYDQAGIGFATTDEMGRVLYCNAAAERYFGAGLGLSVRQGRVMTEHRSQLSMLIARAAMAGAVPGGDLIVSGGDAYAPSFAVSVAPLVGSVTAGPTARGAMLLIQLLAQRLPDEFERRVRDLFGLTGKEGSLATALASGVSLKDAAAERFVSVATARSQLAQIFRKTGTVQQSQLVSLLLRVLPVTR